VVLSDRNKGGDPRSDLSVTMAESES
jgi:hypothetical protein